MKGFLGIAVLCSSVMITGIVFAGSYQSGGHDRGYDRGHRSAGYYQSGPVIVVQPRAPNPSYNRASQSYGPGHVQQRPERRYEQRLPRGHEQRFQPPPHQHRNPSVQPDRPRAGENQFGSGNTQMPRPPQMNQPGPASQSDQGYRGPQQRYGR